MAEERLQKIIATAGIASRRKAEELIVTGHVSVNGVTITELGSKADIEVDDIKVDGQRLSAPKNFLYIALHKPKNVVTTVFDPQGRETVMQFFKGMRERIYPVGRLDYASEGLILLTNDGEFAAKLMTPSSHVTKTYLVKANGILTSDQEEQFRRGIPMHGKRTAPAGIKLIKRNVNPWYEVRLIEGRQNQIRIMFKHFGRLVEKLKRVKIGFLELGALKPGAYRTLTSSEVERFKKLLESPNPMAAAALEHNAPRVFPKVRPQVAPKVTPRVTPKVTPPPAAASSDGPPAPPPFKPPFKGKFTPKPQDGPRGEFTPRTSSRPTASPRAATPRPDGRKPYVPRKSDADDQGGRPPRPFGPAKSFGPRQDAPAQQRFSAPRAEGGRKPYVPRKAEDEDSSRPPRPYGPSKSFGPRQGAPEGRKPYTPRKAEGGEESTRPFGNPRPFGTRKGPPSSQERFSAPRAEGRKPYTPRGAEGSEEGGRPPRPYGQKRGQNQPFEPRSGSAGPKKWAGPPKSEGFQKPGGFKKPGGFQKSTGPAQKKWAGPRKPPSAGTRSSGPPKRSGGDRPPTKRGGPRNRRD